MAAMSIWPTAGCWSIKAPIPIPSAASFPISPAATMVDYGAVAGIISSSGANENASQSL